MRITRIYQPVELKSGAKIILNEEAAKHLIRVLRLSVGAVIKIFNGEGGEFNAHIVAIHKQNVTIEITDYFPSQMEARCNIHLAQGISRSEKMDYVIQKTVELGVNSITPVFTQYCGVKLSEERWERRLQHWRAVAIAACEQCGRDKLPVIEPPQSVADWVSAPLTGLKLILDPNASASFKDLPKPPISSINILIGPEGGFSDIEIALARERQFVPCCLGPRILRTETAAVAAIAVIQNQYGDLK